MPLIRLNMQSMQNLSEAATFLCRF